MENNYRIRIANEEDLKTAVLIANKGREIMSSNSNPQWDKGYPQKDLLKFDIQLSRLYFVYDEINYDEILGMVVFQKEKDMEYEKETFWEDTYPYISIHRLVSLKKGVGQFVFNEAIALAKRENKSLRIDTHPKNIKMQRLIDYFGFVKKGSFHQEEFIDGCDAIAYELSL